MKKFVVLMMSLMMVFAFAACGSNEAPAEEPAETATEEAAAEEVAETSTDVLAGATYRLTSYDYGTGAENVPDGEDSEAFIFGTDGTVTNNTKDFAGSESNELVDVTYTGTYTVDGNNLSISLDRGTLDMIIDGNTLVDETKGLEGDENFYCKYVYTKVE